MSIDSKSHVGFPVDEMYELGYPIKPQRCRLTKFWLSPVDRNIKWQVSPEVNLTVPVLNWSGFFSEIVMSRVFLFTKARKFKINKLDSNAI